MAEAELVVYDGPLPADMVIEQWAIDRPKPYLNNPRDNAEAVETVARSIAKYGWQQPLVVDEDGVVVAGHTRLLAARTLGMAYVPVHVMRGASEADVQAYRIMDNASGEIAVWNALRLRFEVQDLVAKGFEREDTGLSKDAWDKALGVEADDYGRGDTAGALVEAFLVPPFSVLNARDGVWQTRKRAWLALGIQSELGRGAAAQTFSHGPDVTRNADGSLNYTGPDRGEWTTHRLNPSPGGSPRPAAALKKGGGTQRGDGSGKPLLGKGNGKG